MSRKFHQRRRETVGDRVRVNARFLQNESVYNARSARFVVTKESYSAVYRYLQRSLINSNVPVKSDSCDFLSSRYCRNYNDVFEPTFLYLLQLQNLSTFIIQSRINWCGLSAKFRTRFYNLLQRLDRLRKCIIFETDSKESLDCR